MSVTCDTSHLPIGPCSVVGMSIEEIPSRQQSSTAYHSSSRDFAANTRKRARSAFPCCHVSTLSCDFGIDAGMGCCARLLQYLLEKVSISERQLPTGICCHLVQSKTREGNDTLELTNMKKIQTTCNDTLELTLSLIHI